MTALLRIVAWTLALALVALPVVAVLQGWIGAERWPLRTLRVVGELERVEDRTLREAVLPFARHGFFAMRLADAQAAVARLPWVERAEVRKRWPDVVEVRIVEHRPFARWGGERLLSEQGRLFPAAGIDPPPRLPLLDGPEARVADVVALYNESRVLFTPIGYEVRRLTLDPRGSWSLTLSNGTEVTIGSQQARTRLERFARLLPRLLQQETSPLRRADLRYTNGFALEWSDAPEAESGESGMAFGNAPPRTPAAFAAFGRSGGAGNRLVPPGVSMPESRRSALANHESRNTNPGPNT
ncbi:cell division protein FtsQ/DivIB [Luteimonas sp. RD2P54]|uniref:Cell division protein FtsQ n=1 Tax=Luteimonas endophytica TaxID=3042023 RepID=A0ABT6J6C8_9GAMM|nr:cell division protein FtsQ/DivIB [Luteimonas endophytica]MDH5822389.1 cell division protein FtsQ/DivIB [Luteimonas endophytica]